MNECIAVLFQSCIISPLQTEREKAQYNHGHTSYRLEKKSHKILLTYLEDNISTKRATQLNEKPKTKDILYCQCQNSSLYLEYHTIM